MVDLRRTTVKLRRGRALVLRTHRTIERRFKEALMADQGRRQDELLKCLAHLPQALQAIPESNRIQGETLRTIHARLEQSNEQQNLIAEILNKVNDSGNEQRKTVEEVRERVETMADH